MKEGRIYSMQPATIIQTSGHKITISKYLYT